ncbi:MAG: hypothetical protein NZ899_11840, partial [Thermoguttaceae bacterium]|nr:hypothetical protein [Thermoguttaceae bacterium]
CTYRPTQGLAWGPLVREGVEAVGRKLAREAAKEGGELVARRAGQLVARYGDDAARAIQKVGPDAIRLIEEAGPHGQQAVKLLMRFGDNAVWIIKRPQAMAIFVKYGDDVGEALVRHGEMVIPLVDDLGPKAARALGGLNGQNARRLVMLHRSGELTQMNRSEELIDVIIKYGDKAMDFIWRNKGALAATAVLAAFLADPEAFLNGARDLAAVAAENVVRPVAEIPARAADGIATGTNWTLVILGIACLVVAVWFLRRWLAVRAQIARNSA